MLKQSTVGEPGIVAKRITAAGRAAGMGGEYAYSGRPEKDRSACLSRRSPCEREIGFTARSGSSSPLAICPRRKAEPAVWLRTDASLRTRSSQKGWRARSRRPRTAGSSGKGRNGSRFKPCAIPLEAPFHKSVAWCRRATGVPVENKIGRRPDLNSPRCQRQRHYCGACSALGGERSALQVKRNSVSVIDSTSRAIHFGASLASICASRSRMNGAQLSFGFGNVPARFISSST